MRFILFVIVLLVACAPEQTDVSVSPYAGRFARITFPAEPNKVFTPLRNILETSLAPFVVTGTMPKLEGFRTSWTRIAGQTATVYFVISSEGQGTLVRVLTEPSPPPEPVRLARDLDLVADRVKDVLSLSSYTLEPDR